MIPLQFFTACDTATLRPSAGELKARLEQRAEDSQAIISHRLLNAIKEISHWREFDYVLVNRDLDRSFALLRAILAAERLKRERQPGLSDFVRGLQAKL